MDGAKISLSKLNEMKFLYFSDQEKKKYGKIKKNQFTAKLYCFTYNTNYKK